ncbi:hypothetical protein ACOMHN_009887 [Nucella lapillus]
MLVLSLALRGQGKAHADKSTALAPLLDPLVQWSAFEGADLGSLADTSPATRRETPQLGHLGSPMRPADVHLPTNRPTNRSDPQDSPSVGLVVSLRDTIALLQS